MINVPPIGLLGNKFSVPRAGSGAYANILRPASSADWAQMNARFGTITPRWQWNCQEASGDLAASITPGGTTTLAAEPGARTYQQTVTDWTSKWVGITNTSGSGWYLGAGNLWNMSSTGGTSIFGIIYFTIVAPGGTLPWISYGWSSGWVNSSGFIRWNGDSAGSFGTYNYSNTNAHALCMYYDKRVVQGAGAYTDQEALSSVYSVTAADQPKGLGRKAGLTSPAAKFNLWAVWQGADAETMMDRGGSRIGGKTLLQNLGWALPY